VIKTFADSHTQDLYVHGDAYDVEIADYHSDEV